MIILNTNNLDSLSEGAKALLDECNGVECCENTVDNGWSSCPESDLKS